MIQIGKVISNYFNNVTSIKKIDNPDYMYINTSGKLAKNSFFEKVKRFLLTSYDSQCRVSIANALLIQASRPEINKEEWLKVTKKFIRSSEARSHTSELKEKLKELDEHVLARALKIDQTVFKDNPLFYEFSKAHYLDKCIDYQRKEKNILKHKVIVDNKIAHLMVNGVWTSWPEIKEKLKITPDHLAADTHSYLAKGLEENNSDTNTNIKTLRIRKLKKDEQPYQFILKVDYSKEKDFFHKLSKFNFGHSWVYRVSPYEGAEGYVKEESIGYFLRGKILTPDLREQLPDIGNRKQRTNPNYTQETHEKTTRIVEAVMQMTHGKKPEGLAADELASAEAIHNSMCHGGTCLNVASTLYEIAGGPEVPDSRHPVIQTIFTKNVLKFLDKIYEYLPSVPLIKYAYGKIQIITRGQVPELLDIPEEKNEEEEIRAVLGSEYTTIDV